MKNNRNIKTKRYALLFLAKNNWDFLGLEWKNQRPKNLYQKCFFHSQIARKKLNQSCLRIKQLHLKHQRGIGRNNASRTACTIALLGGNKQAALAADLHALHALIPALDDHALAQAELKRIVTV